jgi:SsrA-binding protein
VAKGKKLYDKRDTIAKKDAQRRIQKELRQRQKMY